MIGRGPTTSAHPLGHRRSLLVVPIALICLAIPVLLFRSDGAALIDDTRAYFGAGTDIGVPAVTQVHCVGSRIGSAYPSTRSIGMTDWDCSIDVASTTPALPDDPFKTLPYDEAMAEWQRRTAAEVERATNPANRLNRIERTLATNRTGDIPTLRRLSSEGQPQRFGLIWGGGELAFRWARLLLLSGLFLGAGLGILFMARKIWLREVK